MGILGDRVLLCANNFDVHHPNGHTNQIHKDERREVFQNDPFGSSVFPQDSVYPLQVCCHCGVRFSERHHKRNIAGPDLSFIAGLLFLAKISVARLSEHLPIRSAGIFEACRGESHVVGSSSSIRTFEH